ncbi:DUF1992 domain-containing protein [Gracilibacillus salinarum]|uniref:DUF1992 domain-containing protein n=1 Tax=Gracilibacillus salinarum TaxID=2932255 RepID=A0ABY4GJN5_9BACI|nr:DUF1992 domain-containing protein [Gracilibacillus salinarum]UOQ84550.1 DUF1992 domain-containing protein [Gracilibacillus salinarum]
MDMFSRLAEDKIKKAISDGNFNHIAGKGKPLKKDSLADVPEDLRMSYRIMKNSGHLPEEVQLNKEIASLRDLLKLCTEDEEKERLENRIIEKEIQFQLLLDKRKLNQSPAYNRYKSKIHNRLF